MPLEARQYSNTEPHIDYSLIISSWEHPGEQVQPPPLLPTLHYHDYILLSCFTQLLFLYKVKKSFAILKHEVCHCPLPAETRVQLMTSTVGTGESAAHLGCEVEQGSPGNAAHRCFSTTQHSWARTQMIWVSLCVASSWETHPLCPALSPHGIPSTGANQNLSLILCI